MKKLLVSFSAHTETPGGQIIIAIVEMKKKKNPQALIIYALHLTQNCK